jgi:hypothetical protein
VIKRQQDYRDLKAPSEEKLKPIQEYMDSKITEETLAKFVDEFNKHTPMTIDRYTRGDNAIAGPGLRITYNYTLVTAKTPNDVDISEINRVCTTPLTLENFIKKGGTFSYYYRAVDGGFIKNFDIGLRDCGLSLN